MNTDVICGECGRPMCLRDSQYGKFYGCTGFPECRGTHGAHADGSPKGIPADKPTREARIAAHAEFDRLWKDGLLKRQRAYHWLHKVIGPTRADGTTHIGDMDLSRAHRVVVAVREEFSGWL